MRNSILSIAILLNSSIAFTSCGGGGGSSSNTSSQVVSNQVESYQYRFDKEIELYGFNLGFRDYSLLFEMDKVTTTSLKHYYYDDNSNNYILDDRDYKIIIEDGNYSDVDSFSNIQYKVNQQGGLIAYVGSKDIFELKIEKKENFNSNRFETYDKNIDLNGSKYNITKEYLSNLYIEEKTMVDNDGKGYDSLKQFVDTHRDQPFLGSSYIGLIFYEDNKLLEKRGNQSYTEAGSFEYKTVDNKSVLFIYPTNINYQQDICYRFDFGEIKKSKCYLKSNEYNITMYDKSIYNSILNYLQNNLVDIDIDIK